MRRCAVRIVSCLSVARAHGRGCIVQDTVMKWLVLSCFLLWARHGEGGALKCLPGDDACSSELSQDVEQQELDILRPNISDARAECLSGSEWESNCHRCRCVDGEAQCVRHEGCESIEEPSRCKPETVFKRDCNFCRCLKNGQGVCSLKECPGGTTESPAPPKPIIPKGVDCAPGTTWQSQCNDCVCSPEGRRYCTDKACPGQETEPLLRCAPQSQWKNDCNMCWCNSGRAMCTKMGCMAIPSDMHFDDRIGSPETAQISEPNDLPESPVISNDILESNTDDKHLSENLEDLDTTTDAEENLSEVKLKDLEDLGNNDIDTPIQIPDQVMTDFASNSDSNAVDEDLKLLETLLSHNQEEETADNEEVNKDVEIIDESYINQNSETLNRRKRSVCKPNEEFLDDCNSCKCSESGQSYTCSQNECMDRDKGDRDKGDGGKDDGDKEERNKGGVDKEVEVFMESEGIDHIERHSVCKPSTTFYVGCNPCHCNSDGTDFSCTNKPCPLPEDVEVFHELHKTSLSPKNATKKVCVENKMFIMNCNTCWCNEDGTSYFCTRKVCLPETEEPVIEEGIEKLRIIKRECRPNEVFEIDCNMCRCHADGKSYSCTRRACFNEEPKNQTLIRKTRATSQEAPKVCQPGLDFRLDCNTCLCDNLGINFSCTRIDCAALNNKNNNGNRRKRDVSQKVSADCVPGSVFEQGCNVCRCTDDGGHATCTLKRCQSKENATLSATESSFRCNPGEQFKQSCNDCSCSADGKSVFCTLLVCDDELSP